MTEVMYVKGRQVIEDEYHFIVKCETFTNLRNMYLKPECLNRNGFVQMLKCNDAEIVWNLAVYVFKAVALRKSLLEKCDALFQMYGICCILRCTMGRRP